MVKRQWLHAVPNRPECRGFGVRLTIEGMARVENELRALGLGVEGVEGETGMLAEEEEADEGEEEEGLGEDIASVGGAQSEDSDAGIVSEEEEEEAESMTEEASDDEEEEVVWMERRRSF